MAQALSHAPVRTLGQPRMLLQLAQGNHAADPERIFFLFYGIQPQAGQIYRSLQMCIRDRLERIREAYEAGVDSLEEYREKKQQLTTLLSLSPGHTEECTSYPEIRQSSPESHLVPVCLPAARLLDWIRQDRISPGLQNRILKNLLASVVFLSLIHI